MSFLTTNTVPQPKTVVESVTLSLLTSDKGWEVDSIILDLEQAVQELNGGVYAATEELLGALKSAVEANKEIK